jgi:hypothetical protein
MPMLVWQQCPCRCVDALAALKKSALFMARATFKQCHVDGPAQFTEQCYVDGPLISKECLLMVHDIHRTVAYCPSQNSVMSMISPIHRTAPFHSPCHSHNSTILWPVPYLGHCDVDGPCHSKASALLMARDIHRISPCWWPVPFTIHGHVDGPCHSLYMTMLMARADPPNGPC